MARRPIDSPEQVASNALELSVSDLSQSIKRTVEDQFGYVRVRGEVSGYRGPHSSGHCYFALKDQNARIDAIIWKGVFGKLKIRPEEGMEVIATGKVTTYPGRSSYQIVIDSIEPAGVGALLAQLEERRKRLAAEGLFDEARKQLLPYMPRVIGVVTSPTGAVIRDILHRIAARFPVHVLVWPVRVQGETTGPEVANAIHGFNAMQPGGPIPRPDLVIVARGGGSLEDLWGFNDEIVVRAAAESGLPLISAVGHETDWTLIDHAADLRAPTPTAAAELALPVRSDLLAQLADLARRQQGAQLRIVDRARSDLRALARALASGEEILSLPRQRLDRAGERLATHVRTIFHDRSLRLSRIASALARHSPQAELARRRERLAGLSARLKAGMEATVRSEKRNMDTGRRELASLTARLAPAFARSVAHRRARLSSLVQVFNSLNYTNVLARGYALVRDAAGAPVRAASAVSAGMALEIEFSDGRVNATANGGPASDGGGGKPQRLLQEPLKGPSKTRGRRTRSAGDSGQGSLF
ncbi:MAG: exodeoxyribonuclease VII large subunit [Hyphomicrobiales bacterium]|nr:exodeoxyribonuclease VII large subunit [Hyphomicrobiales bacterium]